MTNSLIGIIMGSDSDLPTMTAAIEICERFEVTHEVAIVSAHRTPDRLLEYARTAHQRGLKVIIAGAGGAAHLPGMVASLTHLPVIGVPIQTRALQGVDSLYSIVQMPAGIPVATVAIGNGINAGLLAIQRAPTSAPSKTSPLARELRPHLYVCQVGRNCDAVHGRSARGVGSHRPRERSFAVGRSS